MKIASVGTAFPENYYSQQVLSEALKKRWSERHYNLERLDQLHRNVLVGGRHLALPLERYDALESFTECNSAYIEVAVEIGVRAIEAAITPLGVGQRPERRMTPWRIRCPPGRNEMVGGGGAAWKFIAL